MDIRSAQPREQSGRDTIARYRAQFKAAAMHCLKILQCKEVKRVYCDFHDDFVVQLEENGNIAYEFYQVKTQASESKSIPLHLIFGLKKRGNTLPESIAQSFIGKLIVHTITFKDSCKSICLLSNAMFDDSVLEIKNEIRSSNFEHKLVKKIIDNFPTAFSPSIPVSLQDIHTALKKIELEPNQDFLKDNGQNFFPIAREAIYSYSEIDLQRNEAKVIIENLCALVERKSAGILISGISPEGIDSAASVELNDLLGILSISVQAFEILKNSGDEKAVKSTSILCRILRKSAFKDEEIAFCANLKVDFDSWIRQQRHYLPEVDFNSFERFISRSFEEIRGGSIGMDTLHEKVDEMWGAVNGFSFNDLITKELLFGGILSELVRSES